MNSIALSTFCAQLPHPSRVLKVNTILFYIGEKQVRGHLQIGNSIYWEFWNQKPGHSDTTFLIRISHSRSNLAQPPAECMLVGCCKELRFFPFPKADCQTKFVCRKQYTVMFPETFKCHLPKAFMGGAACWQIFIRSIKIGKHCA